MEKLRSTLRQLHRDWSEEGKSERDKAYLPIINALNDYFDDDHVGETEKISARKDKKILVPG